MRINNPEISLEKGQITYRVLVESTRGNEILWYSLHSEFADLLSNNSDAPLIALLIPAMDNGEDIHLNGAVSARLMYNISGPLQNVLQRIIPSLNRIKIYPEEVSADQGNRAPGVATGFSGGIDSYCILADHHHSDVTEPFKITHLLFNNVGSHGSGGEHLFKERYERLVPAANLLGLPFLMINSNVDSFYSKKLAYKQTHTFRNASVAVLLQGGIGRYMYASAYTYSDIFVGSTYSMGYSDAITLPLLSTEKLDAFSVGSEYSRVDKTLRVIEAPESHRMLDICVNANNTNGFTNCSTCWKCLRTLATLEIGGYLEYYSASFDLDAYREERLDYFTTLLGSRDPLLKEIVQYADDRNFSFPLYSRARQTLHIQPITRYSKRVWRKLKYLAYK